jgi:ubiquitin carboxyl-terminal hydrolase L5
MMTVLMNAKLEFSLLALRDDPLPALQARLEQYQSSGSVTKAAETILAMNNENNKRERWAVSTTLLSL